MAVAPPTPANPTPASSFWAGLTTRTLVFDLVGLAFTGAAIYTGIVHGVSAPEFGAFTALAGAYLGLKSGA